MTRLRDQLDMLNSERENVVSREGELNDRNKQLQRQCRELKEGMEDAQRKETDAINKKKDLVKIFVCLLRHHGVIMSQS